MGAAKKRSLLCHWGLICEGRFLRSALAFNPNVVATRAMVVEMALANHDDRGHAHASLTAMRTGDVWQRSGFAGYGIFGICGIGHRLRAADVALRIHGAPQISPTWRRVLVALVPAEDEVVIGHLCLSLKYESTIR